MESQSVFVQAFVLADDSCRAEQNFVESGVFDDGVEGFVDAHVLLEVMIFEVLQDLQKQFVGEVVYRDWHDEVIWMTEEYESRCWWMLRRQKGIVLARRRVKSYKNLARCVVMRTAHSHYKWRFDSLNESEA